MFPIIAQYLLNIFMIFMIFQKMIMLSDGTRVIGDFHIDDFFKFIVKFSFQKAETHSQRDSFGYIYGNITSEDSFGDVPMTLAVLDKPTFVDFYKNRLYYNREIACQKMFSRLKDLAYDKDCNVNGKRDFLRKIPCQKGTVCSDEDSPSNVLPGNQFTYVISSSQPRFWYISMVACYRNRTTCQWHAYNSNKLNINSLTTDANKRINNNDNRSIDVQFYHRSSLLSTSTANQRNSFIISYDILLVNGNPNHSTAHPLTFQFSFDQQNLLEMYMVFLLVYFILLPLQIYAVRLQKHPVTKLFTFSLLSEFISLVLITIHLIKFALNGIGEPKLQTIGDILDIFSRTTFMLILLLLAKGWAVTRQQISRTGWIILMSIWVPYCAFHVFLYIWDRTEVDIISDIDEYQTWPGWIVLILRTSFMMWFLYELRNTMKYEHSTKKLDFLLHLGASSLVWFIYLPIVAIVALQVSPMWRYKLLLGITNSADCLAYCVMTGLLWPNRSGQYLLLAGKNYTGMDELDEFNEAPHIVRERERRLNSSDTVSINGGVVISTGTTLPRIVNGDLLEPEDINADLLTDLNKNSHIIA